MVRTWNREPSPDQMKASREASPRHTPIVQFQAATPRFVFDGKIRMPNFLNGLDGQLGEARSHVRSIDTSTHTRYDFSGTGAGNVALSMASEMARSINTCGTMRSGRPKSATARSLVANDTRYAHLDEPHADHVGPGAYGVERAVPGVGQLPADSHVSSATPQRDPYRASAAFMAPERPSSATWVRQGGPDAVYISPDFVPGADRAPSWDLSMDRRPDAADWRHNHARVMAAVGVGAGTGAGAGAGSHAPEAPFSSDLPTDMAGRPLDMSLRASLRNPHGVAFTSKEPRMTMLPPERTADQRASRVASVRGPDETAHLGPGSYAPPTSVGGPRRRTYRVFVDPLVSPQPSDRFGGSGSQADAAAVVAAHDHGSVRAAASAARAFAATGGGGGSGGSGVRNLSARSRHTVSSSGSVGSGPHTARLAGSAAFTGPFRAHKSGAFDWRTDSTLVRH